MVLLGMTSGGSMSDAMGSFRVDIEIENPARPGERRAVKSVLVDTGAELSWVPAEVLESLGIERYDTWRFRQADGTILTISGRRARAGRRGGLIGRPEGRPRRWCVLEGRWCA